MLYEHLDRALAQEFAGHGATIHRLKISNPAFRSLMELNHSMWLEIRSIENERGPVSDTYLESLRKHRLRILDEIALLVAQAENWPEREALGEC